MTGTRAPVPATGAGPAQLAAHVARHYNLGSPGSSTTLTTGYEDCNIDLQASRARVVVKVFSPQRAALAARTVRLIASAQAAGVRHPRLHHDSAGNLVHRYAGHQLIVMDFDPGRSLYDLRRPPSPAELAAVITQAARIHAIDEHPDFVFDPWAITNIGPMAAETSRHVSPRLRRLVGQAVTKTARIDRTALPSALIHADLTKGNVLIGADGQATILDFAVANRLPRVQELAVIAANLTHGAPDPVPARADAIAASYSASVPVPLSRAEHKALHAFSLAATAMELLGALREWHNGNHSPETEYLISLGTAGLSDYLTAT